MVQERIAVDLNRMHGLPCIRVTVTVSAVLGQLTVDATIDELLLQVETLDSIARW